MNSVRGIKFIAKAETPGVIWLVLCGVQQHDGSYTDIEAQATIEELVALSMAATRAAYAIGEREHVTAVMLGMRLGIGDDAAGMLAKDLIAKCELLAQPAHGGVS